MLPPLNVTAELVDQACDILIEAIKTSTASAVRSTGVAA
jgi:hypothetical protein